MLFEHGIGQSQLVLQAEVSFGGTNIFPNLKVGLQILMTVSISVAGCEHSFSKMKLSMMYLYTGQQ